MPQGIPHALMPFIICIETIRTVIRPRTLAIRLTVNIITGHLLLILLGNMEPLLASSLVSALIIVQIALLVLESAVPLIQSYVLPVLRTLYSREVSYD